jgi:hypothetical protein
MKRMRQLRARGRQAGQRPLLVGDRTNGGRGMVGGKAGGPVGERGHI